MTSDGTDLRSPPKTSGNRRAEWQPGTAPVWCLAAVMVWAPLPLGGNRSWAVGVLALVLWALLIAVQALYLRAGATPKLASRLRRAWPPLTLWVLLGLLIAGQSLVHQGTVDEARTREMLLRTLAYGAAFVLTISLARTQERLLALLAAVVAAGVVQAGIAVALHASGASYELLFSAFDQTGRATGTFPNPDHLAGYMELCLSAGLGLLLSQFGGDTGKVRQTWQRKLSTALAFMMSRTMLLRLTLVLPVIALVMTHSRMGNGAFFLSILLVGGVVAVASRRLRRTAIWLVLSMALIDVVIIGQWVGLDTVVVRLQGTAQSSSESPGAFGLGADTAQVPAEESIEQRLVAPRLALKAVADRPWFGHGAGTFYTVFPQYKTAELPWQWTHAHNDYVEMASDTGLPGMLLWVAIGLLTFVRSISLLSDSQPRSSRGVGAAAMMALCTIGLHSMVDFNLQIPANAVTLAVLLGLAWSVPVRASEPAAARAATKSRGSTDDMRTSRN